MVLVKLHLVLAVTGLYDGADPAAATSLDVVWLIVGNVVKVLLELAGGLAVVFIIIGGIYYVTSAGDPSRIKRAKEIIMQAIIGLIVIGVAFGAISAIGKAL